MEADERDLEVRSKQGDRACVVAVFVTRHLNISCIIHTKANMLHTHSDYQTQVTRSLGRMSHSVPRRYPKSFPPRDEVKKSSMYLLASKASVLHTPLSS